MWKKPPFEYLTIKTRTIRSSSYNLCVFLHRSLPSRTCKLNVIMSAKHFRWRSLLYRGGMKTDVISFQMPWQLPLRLISREKCTTADWNEALRIFEISSIGSKDATSSSQQFRQELLISIFLCSILSGTDLISTTTLHLRKQTQQISSLDLPEFKGWVENDLRTETRVENSAAPLCRDFQDFYVLLTLPSCFFGASQICHAARARGWTDNFALSSFAWGEGNKWH